MRLKDLSSEVLTRLKRLRYDSIVEKHEGPENWSSILEFYKPEFLNVDGRWVLLPVPSSHHSKMAILRSIVGDGGDSLTLFLKDTTYVRDPEDEAFFSGFVAICDRLPGEDFFVAIVYHEWFTSAPVQLSEHNTKKK
jgi:hypothetical protein